MLIKNRPSPDKRVHQTKRHQPFLWPFWKAPSGKIAATIGSFDNGNRGFRISGATRRPRRSSSKRQTTAPSSSCLHGLNQNETTPSAAPCRHFRQPPTLQSGWYRAPLPDGRNIQVPSNHTCNLLSKSRGDCYNLPNRR
jgi:hypothetical protein